MLSPRGDITHIFLTNLINERMWDEPFPRGNEKAKAEFKAYNGPNTTYKVKDRFKRAMDTSGFLPRHAAYSLECFTHVSYRAARDYYDDWRNDDRKPTLVFWKSLEDPHLQGSMRLPTPAEAAKMRKEAEAARQRLKEAQAAAKLEEQLAARRKETAQQAKACAAGDLKACGGRGVKN